MILKKLENLINFDSIIIWNNKQLSYVSLYFPFLVGDICILQTELHTLLVRGCVFFLLYTITIQEVSHSYQKKKMAKNCQLLNKQLLLNKKKLLSCYLTILDWNAILLFCFTLRLPHHQHIVLYSKVKLLTEMLGDIYNEPTLPDSPLVLRASSDPKPNSRSPGTRSTLYYICLNIKLVSLQCSP